jgi:predicted MFS family arabinose efflux permease
VYVGTSLALVVGSPMTAAISQLWGWRIAVVAVTVAAAAVTLAAATTLPPMVLSAGDVEKCGRRHHHHRNRRLVTLSVLTLIGVTGHFIAYTFIAVIIRDVVGVHGPHLGWLLAAFGIAGLVSMAAMAGPLDRRPKASVVACLTALALAFVVLTALAFGGRHLSVTMLIGIAAIVLWGASSTALPPMLQSVVMRTAPEDPDGASGLYIAAFQVGIMSGSLLGGLLYREVGLAVMITASTVLVFAATVCVAASRRLFDVATRAAEE